jgi:hypothetical protein
MISSTSSPRPRPFGVSRTHTPPPAFSFPVAASRIPPPPNGTLVLARTADSLRVAVIETPPNDFGAAIFLLKDNKLSFSTSRSRASRDPSTASLRGRGAEESPPKDPNPPNDMGGASARDGRKGITAARTPCDAKTARDSPCDAADFSRTCIMSTCAF